ncbi:MAG TPA: hypothetical protein VGR06_33980 [Actinophytocola sp.]|jgi:hypothetical protein|nr:hypothetical protein [Actinophytocola sp.]
MFTLVFVLTVVMIGPLLMERLERWISAPSRTKTDPAPVTSEVDGSGR